MLSQIPQSEKFPVKLSSRVEQLLCCPICQQKIKVVGKDYQCINQECRGLFPIKNGIPVLIDEENSIFCIDAIVNQNHDNLNQSFSSRIKNKLIEIIPGLGRNIKGTQNYEHLAKLLMLQANNPLVLVVGGASLGNGMEALVKHPEIELVESDIVLSDRTNLICDAHSLPFADNSFDGVIIQAVLEHVVDPTRCVEEIHRVLKKDGLVYAETPFMQQVHMGCYDFTRFTHLGHRRLFRKFEEIDSGAACGPAMAFAWAYEYLLLSFATSKFFRQIIELFVRMTAFPWKYLDYFLIERQGSFDAASAYYFLGRKSQQVLSDRELIKLYQGGVI
jgi:SAM-dependent methyltransferase